MELAPGIAAAIEAGDTVIASSARAARALRRLHGEAQRRRGQEAWQSADILDWDSWLHRLWQKQLRAGNETRLLLTSLQEQQIWARVVRPNIEGRRLISVLGVAELAQQAYGLLCSYGALDFLRGQGVGGSDIESFREWAQDFARVCEKEGWLIRSKLPLALHDAVLAGQVDARPHLLLVGFDRTTPAQQSLIEALRAQGHSVALAEAAEAPAAESATLVEASDPVLRSWCPALPACAPISSASFARYSHPARLRLQPTTRPFPLNFRWAFPWQRYPWCARLCCCCDGCSRRWHRIRQAG